MDVAESINNEENKSSEIEYIAQTIEKLREDLANEIEKNYQLNEQIKSAEIKAYESQVNPHFLNNTLQMIEMMSITGDYKKIPAVVRSLGNMFRFNLEVRNEVTISDEIRNAEDYFKILKLRFGENFEYDIIIQEELKEYICPKFLIQPFVENVMTHAFDKRCDKWRIEILVLDVFENIVFIIKDNGNGITEDKLTSIRKNLANKECKFQEHMGIKNVHERIRLLYGDEYGVTIVSNEHGTQVMINIPRKRDEINDKTADC